MSKMKCRAYIILFVSVLLLTASVCNYSTAIRIQAAQSGKLYIAQSVDVKIETSSIRRYILATWVRKLKIIREDQTTQIVFIKYRPDRIRLEIGTHHQGLERWMMRGNLFTFS
ncbi:hypothetical protein ACOSQ2_032953 [Xanthoceras sorbifolium]